MKKLLIAIALVLVLALVGCEKVEKRTPEGWALYYAEQEYAEDYDGYELFGYEMFRYTTYPDVETDYIDYDIFKIVFVNGDGDCIIYNVLLGYQEIYKSGYVFIFKLAYVTEDFIVDVDIVEVTP